MGIRTPDLLHAIRSSSVSWPTAADGGMPSANLTAGSPRRVSGKLPGLAEVAALVRVEFGDRASWRVGQLVSQLSLLTLRRVEDLLVASR